MRESYQQYAARMSAAGQSYLCESAWNEQNLGIQRPEQPDSKTRG